MLKIFIVILHYGPINLTLGCLKSLRKINKKGLAVKTMVISNTLINQSERKKLQELSDFVIENRKNLGFAGGNNLGIKKALKNGADYILFLNNDTLVSRNFLLPLVNLAEKYLDVGIVGPTIKHTVKGKTFYDYGGLINWKLGKSYHINKKSKRNVYYSSSESRAIVEGRSREVFSSKVLDSSRRYARIHSNNNQVEERDFVSGCCMLIKRSVFEKIGLLNENYFLYLEDVEFCVRAKKSWFTILLEPKSCIFHFGSQSSTELNKIIYSLKNSLKFTWSFVPWCFKPIAIIYNLLFYPAIFLKWQGSRLKRKIFQNL